MFICEKCHTGPRQGFCGGRGSYGPCEGCGISRACSDCHCDNPFNRKSPPKPVVKKKPVTRIRHAAKYVVTEIRYCPVCTTPRHAPGPFDCCNEVILMEKVAKLTLERRKLRKQVRTLKEQWARRNLR